MLININERYERNDFIDITQVPLDIEVVGGLCDKKLGTSKIQVSINGCDPHKIWKKAINQQVFRERHLVPAHLIDVRVLDVAHENTGKSHGQINKVFTKPGMTKLVNLVAVESEEEGSEGSLDTQENGNKVGSEKNIPGNTGTSSNGQPPSATKEKSENDALKQEPEKPKVRFQYDGTLEVNFRLYEVEKNGGRQRDRLSRGNCNLKTLKNNINTHTSNELTKSSLHLLRTGKDFQAEISLRYKVLPGVYCTRVDEEGMSVRIINKVGIDDDFRTYKKEKR